VTDRPTALPEEIRLAYGFDRLVMLDIPTSDRILIVAGKAQSETRAEIGRRTLREAYDPAGVLWSRLDHAAWLMTGAWPHRATLTALRHLLPEPFQPRSTD
jgi:hypothetical protein